MGEDSGLPPWMKRLLPHRTRKMRAVLLQMEHREDLFVYILELISKPGCPIVVYFVSGQPAWEGKADGVSGVDG